MNPELASALAHDRQRELARRAHRQRATASARLPRYRVHWSRTTLSPVGAAGRPERSWVIVISASRRGTVTGI